MTRSEYEPVTDKEKEELKQIEAKIKQYWRDHFPEYEGYEDWYDTRRKNKKYYKKIFKKICW